MADADSTQTKEVLAPGPCAGLNVLEIATMVAGPFCGQYLGDLGAEVVKIESPEGDPMRAVGAAAGDISSIFLQFNRNKKSIVLDLKRAQDAALALRLAQSSDVLVENFRPGVLQRLGLGYDAVRKENPGIVYASISGYGDAGPYADRPAYDQVLQGLVGILALQGSGSDPQPIRFSLIDHATAISAANAVLAALLHRERSGEGQRIVLSLMDCAASFMLPSKISNHTFMDRGAGGRPGMDAFVPIETGDGYVIGHVQTAA